MPRKESHTEQEKSEISNDWSEVYGANTYGLKLDESKVTAIRNIQTRKKVAEIQRFPVCVNYLTSFLPKVLDTAKPLRELAGEKRSVAMDRQRAKAIW